MRTNVSAPATTTASHDRRELGPWLVLASAAVLMLVGGAAHPQVDSSADYEHAVAGMLHNSSWPLTHGVVLAGLVALTLGLAWLRSIEGQSWSNPVRGWTRALTWAAVLGAVEMVPHLFAYLQVDDLERTGSATLLTMHTAIQFVAAPALGVCFAGVAISTARRREFGNGPVIAVLAVVGGLAFGLAGILIALLHEPAVSPLFIGLAGCSIWLLVGAVRRVARPQLLRAA